MPTGKEIQFFPSLPELESNMLRWGLFMLGSDCKCSAN